MDPYQKLSKIENAAVGTVSGTIEVCILQPMLYWKNASQQKLPFTLSPKLLYRGLGASVANMAILTGVQFPLTGLVTNIITKGEQRRLTNTEMVAAAFIGGSFSGLVCGPMEVIMIQQQRFGMSIVQTPLTLYRKFGISFLGRAVSMACGREAFFTAGCLGVAPVLTRELRERYGVSESTAKIIGPIGAGIIASTLSHPLDTFKTCMQGDIEGAHYRGVVHTARTLLAEGGLSRLFLGYGWRTGRMMGSFFVLNECKHLLSPIFFPHHFQADAATAVMS
eukprot:m.244733 g.244733  ORF g.244733 m.244733 type:complete len:279 (-) comp14505_c0_seq1:187-1023(-)